MTNIHRVAAAVIGLAVIGAVPASAQQPGAEAGAIVATGPGVAEVNRVTVIADVVAVNACTQTVTLRGVEYAVDLHVPDKSQFAAIRSHGAPARTRNAAAPLTFRRSLDAFARNFLARHAVRVRVALPGQ